MVQTVRLAERAGLVKPKHVAADGTMLKAYASKHSAMSYARMEREEKRLREEIEQYLRECDAVDQEEDERLGKDRRGDELPEHLSTQELRPEAIRRVMAELEAKAQEKARAGQEPGGRRPRLKGGSSTPGGIQRRRSPPRRRSETSQNLSLAS